ncbi:hypothetical protein NU319_13350, partial [Escherichia coli]|nr:hypothetical protein [Escherichia coli]
MMKTISSQPIRFSDVPVEDLIKSTKRDYNKNFIEKLWDIICDFFLYTDKQKAFKSINKYMNTLSIGNERIEPDPNFNIDANSDLDSYLNLDFNLLSPKQRQTTLCCFWKKIASTFPEPYNTTFKHEIIFSDNQNSLVVTGTISVMNEVVNMYSIKLDKDNNGV